MAGLAQVIPVLIPWAITGQPEVATWLVYHPEPIYRCILQKKTRNTGATYYLDCLTQAGDILHLQVRGMYEV